MFLFSNALDFLLPSPDLGSVSIPQVDGLLSLLSSTVPILHEAVYSLAIGDREVHDFSLLALIGISVLEKGHRCFTLGIVPF